MLKLLPSQRIWMWCVPLLLTGFLLMLLFAELTHMHHDEQLVYHFTRFDLGYTVWYQGIEDVHPPLWFSFFWLWRRLAGATEFAGRSQGVFFSLITLALTWRIGRDWFGRARYGLLAMMTLGINAYFLTYAVEIRPYASAMLLATLSSWFLLRWLKTGSRRWARYYAVCLALMFYVHYFLAFLVALQFVFILVVLRRKPLSSDSSLLRQVVDAAGLAGALWLPWLPVFISQVATLRHLAVEAGNAYGSGLGTPVTTQFTNPQTIGNLISLSTNGQVVGYALVLLFGAFHCWRSQNYRYALLWAFGVPTLALIVNLVAAVYTPRYTAYLSVGLAVVIGVGLGRIVAPSGGWTINIKSSPNWHNWIRPIIGILVAFVFFAQSALALSNFVPVRIPYRDIFRAINEQGQAGDVVYLRHGGEGDNLVIWDWIAYLSPKFSIVTDHDLALASRSRRIWFLTGDLFHEEVAADFSYLEPTHPVQTVIGQCNREWCYVAQLMEAPPWTEPATFGEHLAFWGADVDSVTDTEIRTRLWWRVDEPPPVDYSFGLHLLNSDGTLAAQSDGPIQHYGVETVPTSSLQLERIYIDFRNIALSPDLPPGEYKLALVVYQSWDGVRLTLPDGSDQLVLETIILD